ncbi:MAG: hypothetical protein ABII02_01800 [Candidatus Magasanikbacteria bacterium]
MDQKLKEQFQSLKSHDQLTPDQSWVSQHRRQLLQQIGSNTNEAAKKDENFFVRLEKQFASAKSVFIPRGFALAAQRVLTVSLIFGLAGAGWIATVSASYNSLPGDRLYGVKLATESMSGAVTQLGGSQQDVIKKNIDRAKRRSDEIQTAVQKVKENPDNKPKVETAIKDVALKDLGQSLESVSQDLENISDEEVVEVAKVVTAETGKIKKTLKEVKKTLTEDTEGVVLVDQLESTKDIVEVVEKTTKVVDGVGISAVENAVLKKSDDEAVKEMVKVVVEEKITELKESSDEIKKVNQELEEVSLNSVNNVAQPVSGPTSTENGLVLETENNLVDVQADTIITRSSSTAAISDLDKAAEGLATQAPQLIQDNKLGEVMSAVRDATASVKEAGVAVLQAKKVVSETKANTAIQEEQKRLDAEAGILESSTGTIDMVEDVSEEE